MKKNMVIEFKKVMDTVQVRPMCDEDDVMLSFIRENTHKMSAKQRNTVSDLYFDKMSSLIVDYIEEEYEGIKEEYNHLKDALLNVVNS